MSRRSDRRERRAIDKAAREAASAAILLDPMPARRTGAEANPVPASSGKRLHAWRWPALVLIPSLVAAGVFVEREVVEPDEPVSVTQPEPLMPTAPATSALSSTWYCAAGTATGTEEGEAEQTLQIANQSGAPRIATITAYPEGGQPVVQSLDLPAFARQAVRVSDIVTAPHAPALVEIDGGDVAVQHELVGPLGRSVSDCASGPSGSWTFPVGTTRPGATLTLTLFNPFPGEAVVDVSALSDDGVREPEAYQGLVIPGSGSLTLRLSDTITLRDELTTLVKVRTGRVVSEIVQTSDATIQGDDEGVADPIDMPTLAKGLTATLGAPGPSPTWVFPDGTTAEGSFETFVVYNPSDTTAEVDVQVLLDDPDVNGVAEPFELTIEPNAYRQVEFFRPEGALDADTRVPPGVGHAVVVRARNGVPVVAGRSIASSAEEDPVGLAYTIGAPSAATRWLGPVATLVDQTAGSVTIFNPSADTSAVVSVRASGGGNFDVVEGLDGVTIAPNGRLRVPLGPDGLGIEDLSIEVESDQPIVVESHLRFEGSSIAFGLLTPVAGTVSPFSDTVGVLSADAFDVPG